MKFKFRFQKFHENESFLCFQNYFFLSSMHLEGWRESSADFHYNRKENRSIYISIYILFNSRMNFYLISNLDFVLLFLKFHLLNTLLTLILTIHMQKNLSQLVQFHSISNIVFVISYIFQQQQAKITFSFQICKYHLLEFCIF